MPTSDEHEFAASVETDGFAIVPSALPLDMVGAARRAVDAAAGSKSALKRGSLYGLRNLLETSSTIREVATRPEVWRLVTATLGDGAFATRVTFFDKTPDANWALFWHRDLTIAVRERVDAPGFDRWSTKAGVPHVQPPHDILRRMLAIRIHLDDCGPENGPLRVLPGSHLANASTEASDTGDPAGAVSCCVDVGGIVAMCPLLLHASGRAERPEHRRVLHVEYARDPLPHGLDWSNRVTPID